MELDTIPDIFADTRGGLPYPHVPADHERFQPRIRVQHLGHVVEVYASFVDTRMLQALDRYRWQGCPSGPRLESKAKDPEDCARVSAQRRRKKIRYLCVQARVDRMLTLTTRPFGRNLTKDEFIRAVALFNREMIRLAPKWNYVAVIETQPVSGQYHLHAGIRGRYEVNTIRFVWRTALNKVWGRDLSLLNGEDSPGNADIEYRPGPGGSKDRAAGRIAGYISKYISKDIDGTEFNRKGYFSRRDNVIAKPLSFFYAPRNTMVETLHEFIADYALGKALQSSGSSFVVLDKAANRLFLRIPASLFNPPPF